MGALPLLEIDNLTVVYRVRRRRLTAVQAVSLRMQAGEILGLVGESGCGKTSLGNAVARLVPIASGQIRFNGKDIHDPSRQARRRYPRQVQMIFQDPYGSLNPRLSVGAALSEVLWVHGLGARSERRRRVGELLATVGLEPDQAGRYPHEFSGGQRQRIGIARALALNPSLIIADEPVSALDVSVQIQILNLMKDLRTQQDLAFLFIAHDLGVVRYMCDRVAVMYAGQILESAPADSFFSRPAHPYSRTLLAAVPDLQPAARPPPASPHPEPTASESCPGGCIYLARCPAAQPICREHPPTLAETGPAHKVRCHFPSMQLPA